MCRTTRRVYQRSAVCINAVQLENIMLMPDESVPTGTVAKLVDFGLHKVGKEGAGSADWCVGWLRKGERPSVVVARLPLAVRQAGGLRAAQGGEGRRGGGGGMG